MTKKARSRRAVKVEDAILGKVETGASISLLQKQSINFKDGRSRSGRLRLVMKKVTSPKSTFKNLNGYGQTKVEGETTQKEQRKGLGREDPSKRKKAAVKGNRNDDIRDRQALTLIRKKRTENNLRARRTIGNEGPMSPNTREESDRVAEK